MDETLAKINMVKRSLCDNVRNANKHDGWGTRVTRPTMMSWKKGQMIFYAMAWKCHAKYCNNIMFVSLYDLLMYVLVVWNRCFEEVHPHLRTLPVCSCDWWLSWLLLNNGFSKGAQQILNKRRGWILARIDICWSCCRGRVTRFVPWDDRRRIPEEWINIRWSIGL